MATELYAAVRRFASATCELPEAVLYDSVWSYDAYDGVRYAFLHTTLELRRLAAHVHAERGRQGRAQTQVHYVLAQHQAAFRDFEALLLGVDAERYRQEPSPGEWPLTVIVAHVHEVERFFFAAILNPLRNAHPQALTALEKASMAGEPLVVPIDLPLDAMWRDFERLHAKVHAELSALSDAQIALPSPAWEPEPWPTIEFRLYRFEAHLREHANQVEKTLAMLDRRPTEAKMLLRQMFAALAEVEGLQIGAAGLCADACAAAARVIDARVGELEGALALLKEMQDALAAWDEAAIVRLLQERPGLAYTTVPTGLPAVLHAQYNGRQAIVKALLASGIHLTLAEAAAVGDLARVQQIVSAWPQEIDEYSRDGYSPLQLACYFGHADVAAFLIEQGADVRAVAHNPMQIQPLHAAVAGQHAAIVKHLIAAGADVNARQQNDFTPLMAARQGGDPSIEAMLLAAGAAA